jgi:hypothetical protein
MALRLELRSSRRFLMSVITGLRHDGVLARATGFFAEGLSYDVQTIQYKFRDWIQSQFNVELNGEPVRCYIGQQYDLTREGAIRAINCGVIAAHVLSALSQPKQQRNHLLSTGVAEYMEHVHVTLGVNDAISHLACRRWRFQHAMRLLDCAVAQREEGQAAPALADNEAEDID